MPIRPENRARYPANWRTEIRPAILARAGNRCEGSPAYPDCRVVNGEVHPVTGSRVVLTVAHLDHTPENCAPGNLRAWCQRCHITYDAPMKAAKRRKDPETEITFLRRVADARQQIIDGMIAERCAKQDAEMPRPLADWHEDDGAVVWWKIPVDEPAWIGTPLDDGWPGYHTHWTPHPKLPERER